jgi:hypothetical protein
MANNYVEELIELNEGKNSFYFSRYVLKEVGGGKKYVGCYGQPTRIKDDWRKIASGLSPLFRVLGL